MINDKYKKIDFNLLEIIKILVGISLSVVLYMLIKNEAKAGITCILCMSITIFLIIIYMLTDRTKLKIPAGILIISLMSYNLIEVCTSKVLISVWTSGIKVIYNIMIYIVIFLIIFFAVNRFRQTLVIYGSIFSILGFANYYIRTKRGKPISIADIFSIKTAMEVAGGYSFSINFATAFIILSYIGIVILLCIGIKQKITLKTKYRVGGTIASVCLVMLMLNGNILHCVGFSYNPFTTLGKGYIVGLALEAENYKIDEPKDYSLSNIQELKQKYVTNEKREDRTKDIPNIIVVMNESFSDLSVLGDLNTNEEVMPFYKSINENCIKGNCYASVFGGNTANSEYEFLSGDSMLFYPEGRVVYGSYINKEFPSTVSSLKSDGYKALSFHPWHKGGWDRVKTYSMFGFDKSYFIEDYNESDVEECRGYPTDQYNYDKVLEMYDNMNKGKNFLFNITVQNHGGYDIKDENFNQEVYLKDNKGKFPQAEQYLSLIHESDRQLEKFIHQLEKKDEKIIVCFFGDHQPKVEDEFYDMMYGKRQGELTIEEKQKMYITPFMIWANYDIEEQTIEKTSINYLCSLLLKEAGVTLSPYQNYLLELYQKYPVINANGAIDNSGNYFTKEEALKKADIKEYYNLIYNHVFDKNANETFFGGK